MRELKTIEVDRYVPSETKGMVKHVGMISPMEAFKRLEAHLKENNLLPDEYFNPNTLSWRGQKELPDFTRAECSVSWGGSEGIYFDISLLYFDKDQEPKRFHLATGKTLGESGDDYLRMSRIAAECSMMLNGRGRTVKIYEEEKSYGIDIDKDKEVVKAETEPEKDTVKVLIDSMVAYGLEGNWTDRDIIEALVDVGITQEDFIKAGYEESVKEYFSFLDKFIENSINAFENEGKMPLKEFLEHFDFDFEITYNNNLKENEHRLKLIEDGKLEESDLNTALLRLIDKQGGILGEIESERFLIDKRTLASDLIERLNKCVNVYVVEEFEEALANHGVEASKMILRDMVAKARELQINISEVNYRIAEVILDPDAIDVSEALKFTDYKPDLNQTKSQNLDERIENAKKEQTFVSAETIMKKEKEFQL